MSTNTTLTRRQVSVVLYQGDDEPEIARLEAVARAARDRVERRRPVAEADRPRTLAEPAEAEDPSANDEWQEAALEYDAYVEQAKERAVTVVLEALGRKSWRALVNEHPPRQGHENDKAAGVNEDDFMEPLVLASVLEPSFETDEAKAAFIDDLSDVQFELLYLNAFSLNRRLGETPKDSLLSLLSQPSGVTAK